MARIFSLIVAYFLIGFIVEIEEEWIVCKHVHEWFDIPKDTKFPRFEDRFKDYTMKDFKADLADIAIWPIGLVFWYKGIQKAKKKKIDPEKYY